LLVGSVAVAQPPPAPTGRQVIHTRQVVLPHDGAEPVPVVRVAPKVRTYIALDSPILRDSVKLEGEGMRVRLVARDDTLIAVEGLSELGKDGAVLKATYADGKAPQVLTLALVSDPAQVDKEIQVIRRSESIEAMQAELAAVRARYEAQGAELAALKTRCEASGLDGLALAGVLNPNLQTLGLRASNLSPGLAVLSSWANDTKGWMVVGAKVTNEGPQPWVPGKARLTSTEPGGGGVRVLPVRMKGAQLAPGETGLVAVGIEESFPSAFRLEVLDAEGRPAFTLTPRNAPEARGSHGK
jgi:uncharacterized protein (TIGR02268 family)